MKRGIVGVVVLGGAVLWPAADGAATPVASPCVAGFRSTARPTGRVAVAKGVVTACPQSSLARALSGYTLLRSGRASDALAEFNRALKLDRDWDAATRSRVAALADALRRGALGKPAPQETAASSTAASPATVPVEKSAVSVAVAGQSSNVIVLPERPAAAMFFSPNLDPYVVDTLNAFWGPVDAFNGIGGLDGGGTMWIPGVTDGSIPTASAGAPAPSPPRYQLTVEEEERQCRWKAQRACAEAHRAADDAHFDCIDPCKVIGPPGPGTTESGFDRACLAKCDNAWFAADANASKKCDDDERACTPLLSGGDTPGTSTFGLTSGPQGTPAAVCARLRDCRVCAAARGCGWCAASHACVPGTPVAPSAGSCERTAWSYGVPFFPEHKCAQ